MGAKTNKTRTCSLEGGGGVEFKLWRLSTAGFVFSLNLTDKYSKAGGSETTTNILAATVQPAPTITATGSSI